MLCASEWSSNQYTDQSLTESNMQLTGVAPASRQVHGDDKGMVPVSRHIASARTQRTSQSRVSLLSSHSPVDPHRPFPAVVSRMIESHSPSTAMAPNSEIAGPPASITQPNATQSMGPLHPSDATSQQIHKKQIPRYPPGIPIPNTTQGMGSLQPSDTTSRRKVRKKPVPRYPPGIPIPHVAQSTGCVEPSDPTSRQAVDKQPVPRYPPGISIPNATQSTGSLQPSDATWQQEVDKKPVPKYPPGIPIPANRRGRQRGDSTKSSASSWSPNPITTENNHAGTVSDWWIQS